MILDVKNKFPCAKNTTMSLIYVGTFPTGISETSRVGEFGEIKNSKNQ
jgi:hypothetical protein